jgi:hypothetical protein
MTPENIGLSSLSRPSRSWPWAQGVLRLPGIWRDGADHGYRCLGMILLR